jgi:uncharacterized membrane protein HdeD (DUF308 family)
LQTLLSPPWLRMLQIVLGGICILLSVVILAYIGPAFLTFILILSVILLAVGIERICVGIGMRHIKSSLPNIILGLAIIAFSIVLMQFPIFTSAILIILAAVAILLNGITRIIHGISSKGSGSSRAFLIGVGVLNIAISTLIILRPINFGLVLVTILISIAFLVSGIEMVTLGISGRQRYIPRNTVS